MPKFETELLATTVRADAHTPLAFASTFAGLDVSIVTNPATNHSALTSLWLPDEWNSRLLGVGNGGWSGGVVYDNLYHDGLLGGFASWSTNTGHNSGALDASWALNNPESIVDFSHRAVHLSTVAAKAITGAYYRKRVERVRSYWLGCSTGGAQGLKAAQTYPADFDAIVSIPRAPRSRITTTDPFEIAGRWQSCGLDDALAGVGGPTAPRDRACADDAQAVAGRPRRGEEAVRRARRCR